MHGSQGHPSPLGYAISQFKSFGSSSKDAEIGPESLSLRAGLWVPCRIFWVWFGPALGPNPDRNRRFPAGSLEVFVVAPWEALYIENKRFDLDTLRVPNRSPTPT